MNDNVLAQIEQELIETGNDALATMLKNAKRKQVEGSTYTLGVLGDDLTGKSTIIDHLLNEEILPTTLIPSETDVKIKYGVKTEIYDENGTSIGKQEALSSLLEKEKKLTIYADNKYLLEKSLEVKEYHGVLDKSKLGDMELMADIYKCDAVILVMSSVHALSEIECRFIENFVKYVGASHILLVLNRLSLIQKDEITSLLNYMKNKLESGFAEVKWTVYDPQHEYKNIINGYSDGNLRKELDSLISINPEEKEVALKNTLEYIREQLEKQKNRMEGEQVKEQEECERKNTQFRKEREVEELAVETTLIEFRQRKNNAIELVDAFIKSQFDGILSKVTNEYINSTDKFSWYENKLEKMWNKLIKKAASDTDEYAADQISKDIEWLNGKLNTELEIEKSGVKIPRRNLKNDEKMHPYGVYKKYAPIGMGGGLVLGYCLFRIIGAAIGMGGGLVVYSYLSSKDTAQNNKILNELKQKITKISEDTRKLSRNDLDKLYSNIVNEYQCEAAGITESKYKSLIVEKSENEEQSQKLNKIIKKIMEV